VKSDAISRRRLANQKIIDDIPRKAARIDAYLKEVSETRGWPMGSIDHLYELQIEPSFPCQLKCPGCIHGRIKEALKTEERPYFMSSDSYRRVLSSILDNNVGLDRVALVGRGEPTLNKELGDMISYTRLVSPATNLWMDTNCQSEFKDVYLHLSWMNCSIDGVDAQSYGTYRDGGDFNAAIEFMRTAVERKKQLNANCEIIWKYILFNTTESQHQILAAQQIAKEIGIDRLNLVVTVTGAFDNRVKATSWKWDEINQFVAENRVFLDTIVSKS